MVTGRRGPAVLVLAAGQGTRLRSKTVKLLHPVAGRPMGIHVLETARALRPSRLIAVIGFQAEAVREALSGLADAFVVQADQRGTGHAVLQAAAEIRRAGNGPLLILSGDVPTLRPETLRALLALHRRSRAALSFLSAEVADPTGYGRVLRDARGKVVRIVEHKDATTEERGIGEINSGIYAADPAALLAALRKVRPDNAQGEYYLPDAVKVLLAAGKPVAALRHEDAEEILGVNTRGELARAARALYARKAAALQEAGVTLLDPDRTWIDPRAEIGQDTVIHPDVYIEGPCRIGEDCTVLSGCRLTDTVLGDGVLVRDHCVVQGSRVETGASIGPFAHLRPGSILEPGTRVGNFVELKKTRLGRESKASHLAYLGDATIGVGCNIGAGTITCNYDGVNKNPTVLEDGVFIGSDSQLVAPVTVGRGAYVAAGATVTEDVPPGALAIARARQTNIEGWVERRKAKQQQPGGGRH